MAKTVTPSKPGLHPEIDKFRTPGGLFDVEPSELDLNIGRRCRIKDPSCPADCDLFTIATVQKNYRGEVCYRIVADSDRHRFGVPATVDSIEFID